jgi:hypothetical protein
MDTIPCLRRTPHLAGLAWRIERDVSVLDQGFGTQKIGKSLQN